MDDLVQLEESDDAKIAVVQFLLDGVKKAVPVSRIRLNDDGDAFAPKCVQDLPSDSIDVKWQKSDLESDGYFPAKVICLAGSVEGALDKAKDLGHKLTSDCVMLEPAARKIDVPEMLQDKSDRKKRAKRLASPSPEDHKVIKRQPINKKKSSGTKKPNDAKKKAPTNRLAADPVVVARLKDSLASAFKSNPLLTFDHLQNSGVKEVESIEKAKDSDKDDDDLNTTVSVNENGSDESSSSSSDSSSSASKDSISNLMDENSRLQSRVRELQVENKDLKTQYSVVWGERKAKVSELESELGRLKKQLKAEMEKNSCLQIALVNASNAPSGSPSFNVDTISDEGDESLILNSSTLEDLGSPLGSDKLVKVESPAQASKSGQNSSTLEDLSPPLGSDKVVKAESPAQASKSGSKKKSGKKYIDANAEEIDSACQRVLGFLNRTEQPIKDKNGNVDLGNGIKIKFDSLMEILKTKTGGPEQIARNLTLLVWGHNEMATRSLDGKGSNRYPNAPKKVAATPSKVNAILGAVKAKLLRSGSQDGPTMTTTLYTCRRSIGSRLNEAATSRKKSSD